jgi:hypothetical protein
MNPQVKVRECLIPVSLSLFICTMFSTRLMGIKHLFDLDNSCKSK